MIRGAGWRERAVAVGQSAAFAVSRRTNRVFPPAARLAGAALHVQWAVTCAGLRGLGDAVRGLGGGPDRPGKHVACRPAQPCRRADRSNHQCCTIMVDGRHVSDAWQMVQGGLDVDVLTAVSRGFQLDSAILAMLVAKALKHIVSNCRSASRIVHPCRT